MKSVTHCFNCGEHYHIGANCPTKERSTKCFDCQEHGYVISKSPKKVRPIKPSCFRKEKKRKVLRKQYSVRRNIFQPPISTVYKLKKCIYGLKQAGRYWNEYLTQVLLKNELIRYKEDPYLLLKREGYNYLYCVI